METYLYKDKQICAYDIVNANDALNYELKKEWKLASSDGLLICEECGTEVILKANNLRKRMPHFAHKIKNSNCSYNNDFFKESDEHKKAKMLLYKYLKASLPPGRQASSRVMNKL